MSSLSDKESSERIIRRHRGVRGGRGGTLVFGPMIFRRYDETTVWVPQSIRSKYYTSIMYRVTTTFGSRVKVNNPRIQVPDYMMYRDRVPLWLIPQVLWVHTKKPDISHFNGACDAVVARCMRSRTVGKSFEQQVTMMYSGMQRYLMGLKMEISMFQDMDCDAKVKYLNALMVNGSFPDDKKVFYPISGKTYWSPEDDSIPPVDKDVDSRAEIYKTVWNALYLSVKVLALAAKCIEIFASKPAKDAEVSSSGSDDPNIDTIDEITKADCERVRELLQSRPYIIPSVGSTQSPPKILNVESKQAAVPRYIIPSSRAHVKTRDEIIAENIWKQEPKWDEIGDCTTDDLEIEVDSL